MTTLPMPPQADGLYDPRYEHDACGVAMVAKLDNVASHDVVMRALEALDNLEHRGAEGADTRTGDGAGILVQLPDAFLRSVVDFELPPAGRYGVGMCFLPQDPGRRAKIEQLLELNVRVEGQHVLGWRDVPVDGDHVGDTAARSRPYIRQLFIEAGPGTADDQMAFERKLYVIRRIVELATGPDFYAPSFSSRTLVYKGMLISHQLRRYFRDLQDPSFASGMALVHSRFSTNTFPSWELSHPYRVIAHNGEINTLMGNKNWMRARESQLASALFGRDLNKVIPIVREGGSDSATFDNVLELLMLAGRSLPHAVMMMIPEAYAGREDLPEHLKGFYAFHSCFMEPWDGPAAVCFTDGSVVGATLDRNGLRPGRWMETHDGYVILGSETGMLGVRPDNVKRLGRLAPGKLFLVDLEEGRIVEDEEVKEQVATQQPYGRWYADHVVHFDDLPEREPTSVRRDPLHVQQQAFGWSQEDLRVLLAPMAGKGEEPIGSMGNDAALAVLSDQRPSLFAYFKQLFAQVTNPPIDPIREAVVMSLATGIGAEGNLLDEAPDHARQIAMDQPILRNHELETLRQIEHPAFRAHTIDITWPVAEGPRGLIRRLADACDEAYDAIRAGVNILILSDRRIAADRAPIPSLLAVAAVHHHLVREGNRLQAGLVLESGEPREIHHFATLIGYGASAINPYLMFESLGDLVAKHRIPGVDDVDVAERNVVKAVGRACSRRSPRWGSRRCSPTTARRSSKPSAWTAPWWTATSRAPRRGSAGSTCRRSRSRRSTATPAATRRTRRSCPWAGSTRGAATASTTCGTPSRSRCSSTRSAPGTAMRRTSTPSSPRWSTRTPRAGRPCAAC
jgi:glutamate synthase (NADPH/NADH) large chain/glutamate synthase (ferredoxin)